MNNFSSIALSAALAVAGVGAAASAQAHPYASVDVAAVDYAPIERVGVWRPYYRPYFRPYGMYRHHEFGRGGYERFYHRRWDHY